MYHMIDCKNIILHKKHEKKPGGFFSRIFFITGFLLATCVWPSPGATNWQVLFFAFVSIALLVVGGVGLGFFKK